MFFVFFFQKAGTVSYKYSNDQQSQRITLKLLGSAKMLGGESLHPSNTDCVATVLICGLSLDV